MDETDERATAPFDGGDDLSSKMEEAFLIINGVDLFPLKFPVVSMGRRTDNVLVVNDPRVSRSHAELRAIHGRYVLFDLHSSGGTYVNGTRVEHSVIYDGDVISLAGVHMIFRQKNIPRPDLSKTAMF